MSEPAHSSELKVALKAAELAAKISRDYYHGNFTVTTKSDLTPVTQADVECEQAIREVILAEFPDHGFFGEETGTTQGDAKNLWLVDPIDGTKAFVRQYPFFSTQIALMREGEIVLGVSCGTMFGETAWAERGGGAWLNGERLSVSDIDDPSRAALSTGNLKSIAKGSGWSRLGALIEISDRIRGYGDFYHYHLLASGKIEVVVESDVNILDIAALSVIVTEAGGVFTDLNGANPTLQTRSVLAANPVLHAKFLEQLKGFRRVINLPIFQVAAFTDQSFGGNPAAVIPLESWLDDVVMQKIAAENNLSETAFFVPVGPGEWHIRWFTPAVEVPLCGHATLASAAVLRSKLKQKDWPITLQSASGPLIVDIVADEFVLDLPANFPRPAELPVGLLASLDATVLESYICANDIYMVVLPDEASVAGLCPDFSAMAAVTKHGVIATAPGDHVDFVSRFFAPAIGITEDPVTGAAHCVLTPYWSNRLGKDKLDARQISERLGVLKCENHGDRVKLRGNAVFFLEGELSI